MNFVRGSRPRGQPNRPIATASHELRSPRLWLLAVGELAIAASIAAAVLSKPDTSASGHDHMIGMAMPAPPLHWGWVEFASVAVMLLGLAWWWHGSRAPAALAVVAGIGVLVTSEPMRILATQSHLVAMAAMELVLVALPLTVLAALPHREPRPVRGATTWRSWSTMVACGTGVLYGGSILVLHLPPVHQRGMASGVVPLWIPLVLGLIGLAYWVAVLRTSGRVPVALRRAVLVGSQEVAAFVGLLAIFGAWAPMSDESPLGITAAWDQRLGGLLMMITCAAVAIPTVRRLSVESETAPHQLGSQPTEATTRSS
jgi:hypothetical protein